MKIAKLTIEEQEELGKISREDSEGWDRFLGSLAAKYFPDGIVEGVALGNRILVSGKGDHIVLFPF